MIWCRLAEKWDVAGCSVGTGAGKPSEECWRKDMELLGLEPEYAIFRMCGGET